MSMAIRLNRATAGVLTALALLSCGGDASGPGGSVARVTVEPTSTNLPVGQSLTLEVTLHDADGNRLSGRQIFFTTDAPNLVSISSSGEVRALTTGTARVAASAEGQSAIATITVIPPPVASVIVNPSTTDITVGASVQLSATTRDADGQPLSGRPIIWSSSNQTVATVSGSGMVTGRAPGTATITATSEGKSGSATVQVKAVPVASLAISPANSSLKVGEQVQLTATTFDASGNVLTGRVITWETNSQAVSVTQTGLVQALAPGSAVITVRSEGKSATASVTVAPPAPSISRVTISPTKWDTKEGRIRQFTALAYDQNNRQMTGVTFSWTTSNSQVVTVTQSGLALALDEGKADIIVSAGGRSASAKVDVDDD